MGRPKVKKEERNVPICITLHPSLIKKLNEIAKKKQMSRSIIIRELVKIGLENE